MILIRYVLCDIRVSIGNEYGDAVQYQGSILLWRQTRHIPWKSTASYSRRQ